ncbi:HAD family hydrolase [Microbacterium sp. ASV49]|uniref:HAD family hydrolase n=1 Tax=Microbacterium candidum TaxID=3041922 RepID=A0ABT7N257_9MICO|nr:HAD family hydrolase [Microbacterium sp. ASV49]MDL9980796.1 HAD family hydrolase [Microbacterium sp. ASV49]
MSADIRAVCFDLDGTLLRDDHVDGVVRAVADELAMRYPGVDAAALAEANENVWWDYWPAVGDAWMRGEVPGDEVPTEVWRRSLAQVGVTDATAATEAFELHTALEGNAFALYPEAMDVLAALRDRGIRTAVITNGPSGLQRSKLMAVDLAEGFDAVLVSGEVGIQKPDAAIFALAVERLGVSPGEALHIGDNQVADVGGARGAGLTAVWIDRNGAALASEPHHVVDDLRGLLPLV